MFRCLAYAFTAIFKSRARLVDENLCLRLYGAKYCRDHGIAINAMLRPF